METEKAVEQLKYSVDKWNQWRRENNLAFPDLSKANLENANLRGANLAHIKLNNAYLHNACLQGANLKGAILEDAYLVEVDLQGASLTGANLQRASLAYANLQESNLSGANLQESDLSNTSLRKANLFKTSLEKTDLSNATNYQFDVTKIRDVFYSNIPNDPWSILKQKYTGSAMIWTIFALIAASIPLVAKVLYWSAHNVYQANQEGVVFTDTTHDQYSVISLVLGLDRDFYYWIIPTILIIYNILRGFLTWRIAPMRDQEESSGYTPAWKSYSSLYRIHKVVKWIAWLALAVFLINAYIWLSQDVWIPK